MSITIKDIAKLANVSHTTVSRALNNSELINEETKAKIKAIAEELNYVPNYNAKSLVLDKSYTIGLFFSSIIQGTSPSFFFQSISGINSVIEEKYNIVIRGIDSYKDFSSINNKRFDGIILMSQCDSDNEFIYHVKKQNIPLIILDREIEEKSLINIISNDEEGSFNAVEYLIKNGHKDIGIIGGKDDFKSAKRRESGFMKALINYKIPINKEYIVSGNYDMKSGYRAMKKLIELPKRPTGIFCSNDDMAIGAIKAAFDNGLRVPEDISIIGFDDVEFSAYLTPALTTIKRPIEEMSVIAGRKIIEIINSGIYEGEKIYAETDLVLRDSVLNLNKK